MTAIAVTIAGSDSGGGAGIQADLKTFSALGVYGASIVTALTAQNTCGVSGIHDVPPDFVRAQIEAVFSDLAVNAVKIGMLSKTAVIEAVAAELDGRGPMPVVLDPVMIATSGDRLLDSSASGALETVLIPLATLITPNLAEAAVLSGEEPAETEAAMRRQGETLLRRGARAVLMKGGHGAGVDSTDLLITHDDVLRLPARRIDTRNTHGTGCTLSAAIAAGFAKGLDLPTAVKRAKVYLTGALEASERLKIGHGHGPVHHFHALWSA
jgi:hydroxymethylpyrimidine/phosphomethylpyrimidine kinase